MNLGSVMLCDLLGDKAEAEVVNCEVIVQVVEKLSDTRFVIADQTKTAKIEFEPKTQKMAEKLTEGKTYRFFALHKVNSETLLYKKSSYLKEDTDEIVLGSTEKKMYITTKDLLGKPPKTIVRDPVLLKVVSIHEATVTSKSGIPMKKVLLADNHHALYMTFWRQDVPKVAGLMKEGDVVSIRNFELDRYPDPEFTNKMKPQDFVFRTKTPATIIQKVEEGNIPEHHVDVLDPIKDISVQGLVKFIDQVYEYKSCPGKKDIGCGKAVKEDALYCGKQSCRVEVNKEKLIDDYKVTLVVFGSEGFKQITAFRKSLKEFENEEKDDIQEKLNCLVNVEVNITLQESNKDDEDPIAVKIAKL